MKKDVHTWALAASPGTRVIYHSGISLPPSCVSEQALRASDEGLVFLAQRRRRNGPGFDYEATRITRACARRLGLIDKNGRSVK